MAQTSLQQFFSHLKIHDLIPQNFKLVSVEANDKVADVLQILTEKKILSVPVHDKTSSKWLGFLDMLDLLSLSVFLFAGKSIFDDDSAAMTPGETAWNDYIQRASTVLKESTIRAICNVSLRNHWKEIPETMSLMEAVRIFASDSTLHRIAVRNEGKKVVGVLTQSRIVESFFENIEKFPQIKQIKLKEWHSTRPVLTVPSSELAVEGFQTILEHKVSAVAVVDNDGHLEGALSASDLKGSPLNDILTDLMKPVQDYITRPCDSQRVSKTPLYCTMESSMGDILTTLVTKHVHRLFIIDEQFKAVGVVSLYDVLKFLSHTKL